MSKRHIFSLTIILFGVSIGIYFAITSQILPLAQAAGSTYYVDDNNCPAQGDGSVGNPYCSSQTVFDQRDLAPGDQVVIQPGWYPDGLFPGVDDSGIDGDPIVVTCASGENGWRFDDPEDASSLHCRIGNSPTTVSQTGWHQCGGPGDQPPECTTCADGLCENIWWQEYQGTGQPRSLIDYRIKDRGTAYRGGVSMEDNGIALYNGLPTHYMQYLNDDTCQYADEVSEIASETQRREQTCVATFYNSVAGMDGYFLSKTDAADVDNDGSTSDWLILMNYPEDRDGDSYDDVDHTPNTLDLNDDQTIDREWRAGLLDTHTLVSNYVRFEYLDIYGGAGRIYHDSGSLNGIEFSHVNLFGGQLYLYDSQARTNMPLNNFRYRDWRIVDVSMRDLMKSPLSGRPGAYGALCRTPSGVFTLNMEGEIDNLKMVGVAPHSGGSFHGLFRSDIDGDGDLDEGWMNRITYYASCNHGIHNYGGQINKFANSILGGSQEAIYPGANADTEPYPWELWLKNSITIGYISTAADQVDMPIGKIYMQNVVMMSKPSALVNPGVNFGCGRTNPDEIYHKEVHFYGEKVYSPGPIIFRACDNWGGTNVEWSLTQYNQSVPADERCVDCVENATGLSFTDDTISSEMEWEPFDYHLLTDSVLKNTGADPATFWDGTLIGLDMDDETRPQGFLYDIGADEFTETVSTTPPTITPIANQSVAENGSLVVNLSAADDDCPNGSCLDFDWSSVPSASSFGILVDTGNGTGTLTFNPSFDQAGSYAITVSVRDTVRPEEPAATEPFTLTVSNVNRAPVLVPIGPKTIHEQEHLQFTVTATDADASDTLTLTATNLPTGATFTDNHNRTGTFSWTPASSQANTYPNVHFEVSDGTALDSEDITITVLDGIANCTPNWQCTDWSVCSESLQTRTCTDNNSCGSDSGRPVETVGCDSTAPGKTIDLLAK